MVAIENAELIVLQTYMPEQMSEAEVAAVVAKAVAEVGATDHKIWARSWVLLNHNWLVKPIWVLCLLK